MTAARQERKPPFFGGIIGHYGLGHGYFRNGPRGVLGGQRPPIGRKRYDRLALIRLPTLPRARRRFVPGDPSVWAVAGQRLYLFYSEQTRASFLTDPGRIFDTA